MNEREAQVIRDLKDKCKATIEFGEKKMLEIGQITWGRDLLNLKRPYSKFIWSQCPACKKERWVEIKSIKVQTGHTLCGICSGRKNGKLNKKNFGRM